MPEQIKKIIIEDEMKKSYLDYSMSVIVSRALPDVRDGLKPVHRRVLFTMNNLGLFHDKAFKKSANIVGTCMAKYHPHGDIAIYDSLVRMAQDFSLRYPLVKGQGNFGCFTGDTKIKLLDGTSKSFKELYEIYKNDEVFYVYSIDKKGDIVVGEAKNPRLTKKNAKLVEITLNNGEKIRCTSDHRFLLKNLKYKEAKDLTSKDSLMPGYFKLSPIRGNTELKDYLMIKNNKKGGYNFVHDIIDGYNLKIGAYTLSDGPVRHHIDFDKFNNNPSNIKRINWNEHTKLHNNYIKELWKNEDFRKKQSDGVRLFYKKNPEYIKKSRERIIKQNKDKNFIKKNSKRLKEVWKDSNLRQKLSNKLKKHYDANPEKRKVISEFSKEMWSDPKKREYIVNRMREVMGSDIMKDKLSKIQQNLSKREDIIEKRSKKLKEFYRNNPKARKLISKRSKELWREENYRSKFINENYNHMREMAKKAWLDEKYRKIQTEKAKNQWKDKNFRKKIINAIKKRNLKRLEEDPEFMKRIAQKAALAHAINWKSQTYKNKVIRSKILYYVNRLISTVGEENINEDNYNNYRTNNCYPKFNNAIKYFKNINEIISLAKEYNHYIVSVKILDYTEDVYDISVEKYHNFLLDCGVFVHNSIDGDAPSAMRYSEVKLNKLSEEMLEDIEKDTVDFADNYDNSTKEPLVLPSKIPNLLLNGTTGIAVGMATNIPPHNMNEICNAAINLIENPNLDDGELIKYIKGPDFPTGGIICGTSGIKNAYKTGRGKIVVRAKAEVEKDKIIITEIPYQVNKATLVEGIANLVRDKIVEGISDIRDESDRKGMRIVIELKRDANGEVILNQLYKHTALESSFGVIMLALVNNQPKVLNLKEILDYYILHRKDVITRRCKFDLNNAEKRAHILEGLKIALANIDDVVRLIKNSKSVEEARNGLVNKYNLSSEQSQAILDMRLQRLTSLEQTKLRDEYDNLLILIKDLKNILANERRIYDLIKKDLIYLKKEYGDERRTEILEGYEEIETEDLIKKENVVVTLSNKGYVKRMPLDSYRAQRKGGKGVIGASIGEDDFVEKIFVCDNHNYVLFFSDLGRMYWMKAYQIPEASRYSKGNAIVNLLRLKDEKINTMLAIKEFDENKFLVMITKNGIIKKTKLSGFRSLRQGLISVSLKDGDSLVKVLVSDGNKEFIIASNKGRAVRFAEKDVKSVGRGGCGVKGINLRGGRVVGVEVCDGESLLTITENGYGKRTILDEYRVVSRGGTGVTNIKVNERNGDVAGVKVVDKDDEVMFISKNGIIIRVNANGISEIGRNTLGVRLMKLDEGDKVIGVAKIEKENKDFTLGGF